MLFLYSNDLHADALLTANIMFSIWQFSTFLQKRHALNFLLAFTGAGLAMITKGPVGLAVPAFAVASHLMMKGNWRQLISPVWLGGLPVLGIILFPVLKSNYDTFGWEGIEFFFWTNNAGRISGEYAGNNTDFFFYLHTMLYIFLPWSLFALGALIWQARYLNMKKHIFQKRPEYFTYGALLIYTFILSIARQKAPHYFFPMVPLLSIIVADFIVKICETPALQKWYNAFLSFRTLLVVLMWMVLFLMVILIFPSDSFVLWGLIFSCLAFLTVLWHIFRYSTQGKLIVPLIATAISFNLVLNIHFFPNVYQYQGVIQAAYQYNDLAEDSEDVYAFLLHQFEAYFYPKKVAQKIKALEDMDRDLQHLGGWFITTSEGYDILKQSDHGEFKHEEIFPHRKISRMNLTFLNPETRNKDLKKIYLLKLSPNSQTSHIKDKFPE
ncbi:MAG: glycosyltransferase family 39 protein [Bacteroidota bacterium]